MISALVSGSRGLGRAAHDIVPSKCPTPARCMNVYNWVLANLVLRSMSIPSRRE